MRYYPVLAIAAAFLVGLIGIGFTTNGSRSLGFR